jgi:hypothetical protein
VAVYQRHIVEVPFNLTQRVENHPAIVLSTTEAIEHEEAFIAVMMTSTKMDDEYTWLFDKSMLESGRLDKSYVEVRLHLISYFKISDIIHNSYTGTRMRLLDFNSLVARINRVAFGQK